MNAKEYTGVNFCLSPKCISPRQERVAIARKISSLLKKDELSDGELIEIDKLKSLYAQSLKGER